MPVIKAMRWFGVRAIYLFGKKADGRNIFEERICVFSGLSHDEALEKADAEADRYATDLKLQRYSLIESYEQNGDALIDGYEVWSTLFEYEGDLEAFVSERYDSFEYRPDP